MRRVSDEYFLEIESHFARRRGTPFVLSAKDWALMQSWAADGVPLPVVIEAIDSVFDKNETQARKRTINGLQYCRHAIKELWHERKGLQIGAHEDSPEENPEPLLEALAVALEASSAPFVSETATQIRALMIEKTVPRIEERLIELESELIARLLETGEAESIRADVARAVAGIPMDEKTRARTEEATLRRFVRERFAMPRLTLFF